MEELQRHAGLGRGILSIVEYGYFLLFQNMLRFLVIIEVQTKLLNLGHMHKALRLIDCGIYSQNLSRGLFVKKYQLVVFDRL